MPYGAFPDCAVADVSASKASADSSLSIRAPNVVTKIEANVTANARRQGASENVMNRPVDFRLINLVTRAAMPDAAAAPGARLAEWVEAQHLMKGVG